MNEDWRYIDYYTGDYIISNNGRIISLKKGEVREMNIPISKYGYSQITLCKDGKYKTHRVHRLVAEAFIPNPENKPCINHKDSNRINNHIGNLEWCTHLENNIHSITYGGRKKESSNNPLQHILE